MKKILWLLLVVTNISFAQNMIGDYPSAPLAKLTPGELCDRPASYRYPENIAYCDRNVTVEQKSQIFAAYRDNGYRLNLSDRASYKIDHYLPLCAGGSNNNENLWPQHVSVGVLTDPLEQLGCEKMAKGKLTQAKFVLLIKRVKNDINQVSAVRLELSRL